MAERWTPDAFVFALLATFLVIGAAAVQVGPTRAVALWGSGLFELLPFTMQMSLVVITGSVLATSPPAARVIGWIAARARSDRGAAALVALFAMISAWLNWGFSLIFSAMLCKEVARRRPTADYRVLAAASFMGLGSIWAQGLSGSAALLMASEQAMPERLRAIVAQALPGGVIPLSQTIFLWQSLLSVAIEVVIVTVLFALLAPEQAKGAAALGVDLTPQELREDAARTPGERLEHSRWLSAALLVLLLVFLVQHFASSAGALRAFGFDTVNLIFLTLGVAAHGTLHRLMRAVREATPGIWAIILQYPFYAGIASVISKTQLNAALAHAFVSISNKWTFPPLIAIYSALLGMFVPSGGSKWVIEAPYVLQAAQDLKVHLGWMVAVYDLGEALANLVQPFWMLPVLSVLGLRTRDVMGYTFLVFLVLTPVVLVLVTLLGATLGYPA